MFIFQMYITIILKSSITIYIMVLLGMTFLKTVFDFEMTSLYTDCFRSRCFKDTWLKI